MGDEFGGEEPSLWDSPASSIAQDEKIFVSVRLRPLNDNEIGRNDLSEWECINNTTIIYKNNTPERSAFLPAYQFDRVFGYGCSTKQVYEEGAKEVALSVVNGINSSIFAYGQTSSGKTYTMSGITECAVADIYDYLERHQDREFVLKFSAMEIYNEAVRDLLSSDSTPLRLLDDPERGTVVERLTEETLRDENHLLDLISICYSQRQIGETSLNETSSRSHQILRLTIESSARKFSRTFEDSSTLSATVNFVDLAGSERASQTLSAGARLKEGCHINRSLLTLGTVIRKLSKGRNGHVPYRDSKLTRILQNSLGGNARTAIVCTISPARSYVEQSRNTLLFATCAKEVATNAQVNVVMSDKVLLKHLQRELSRLENELRSSASALGTCDSAALLKEKEIQIEKMDKEIKELIQQRDLAQSRVEDLLRSRGEDHISGSMAHSDKLLEPYMQNAPIDEYAALPSSNMADPCRLHEDLRTVITKPYSDRCNDSRQECLQLPENPEGSFLYGGTSPRVSASTPHFVGPDPFQGWEEIIQRTDAGSDDICKEVRCIEMEGPSMNFKIKLGDNSPGPVEKEEKLAMGVSENIDEIRSPQKGGSHVPKDYTYDALRQKIQEMQKTIKYLVSFYPIEQSPYSVEGCMSSSRSLKLSRSRSCRAVLMSIPSPVWFEKSERDENTAPNGLEKDFQLNLKYGADTGKLSRKISQTSSISMDEKVHIVEMLAEGDITIAQNVVAGENEMDKLKFENQFGDDLVLETQPESEELGTNVNEVGLDTTKGVLQSYIEWPLEFERQQREIIELWNECKVPLVHRTYFFLLFKGDPLDSVYLEVELRRLSFLRDAFSQGTTTVKGGQTMSLTSSIRALNRERVMLSKQMQRRFTEKEREDLYQKWGIGLNTKQRRLQLANLLWTVTKDTDHIKASAVLTAKLVGFVGEAEPPKEMFGLSFSPRPMNWRSQSWKHSLSSII